MEQTFWSATARIAASHHGLVPAILRGKQPEAPRRIFTQLDMRAVANADFGSGASDVLGWMDEPDNDLASMPIWPPDIPRNSI